MNSQNSLSEALKNVTQEQIDKATAQMVKCTVCDGIGGTGIMVGGVSSNCNPPNNHELPCKRCEGKGYIVPRDELNVSMIAAMSLNRVIGKDNELPWHIPEDMKFFRTMTRGSTVIMGRKTFESIGRTLPNRFNIIISKTLKELDCSVKDAIIVNSLEAALCACKPTDKIMVIGGGEIYRQALPYASTVHLTIVDLEIDGDTYFPELDTQEWKNTKCEVVDSREPSFSFTTFERR